VKAGLPRSLRDRAAAPYRGAGRFAWHFARNKLQHDPVFRLILQHGLVPPESSVLDIGCGQGLLASLLRAASQQTTRGEFPPDWPLVGTPGPFRGIDSQSRDVERARIALGSQADFVVGDMRETDFGQADTVVVVDVLHYVDYQAQEDILRRIHTAISPDGRLILRVGEAGRPTWSRISKLVDGLVLLSRRQWPVAQHCRTQADWIKLLEHCGFSVDVLADNEHGAFANILMIARGRTVRS
jgi:SAM-dependent methyltransferase